MVGTRFTTSDFSPQRRHERTRAPTAHRRRSTLNAYKPARTEAASQVEITRTCLPAHKLLMEIQPKNVAKFKDVAQFLAEDLKRQEEKAT